MESDGDASAEPTEAEVASDRQLAVQTAWASLTGVAVWLHPAAGAAATALTPIVERIATFAVKRLGDRRVEHAAETLLHGAAAAGEPVAEFIDKAVADDRRHELFARTMVIAQDTALRNKRRALGRALAAGVTGDDARIDDELLFIRAVADLDEPHIKLLARMTQVPHSHDNWPLGYWDSGTIPAQMPELGEAWRSLLSNLELHGLVEPLESSTTWQGYRVAYRVTRLGELMLERLADDDQG